jgi:hypothetical protein
MCDYSLAGIPNRLAAEGEQLMVFRFPTGARGLASPGLFNQRSIGAIGFSGDWPSRVKATFIVTSDATETLCGLLRPARLCSHHRLPRKLEPSVLQAPRSLPFRNPKPGDTLENPA